MSRSLELEKPNQATPSCEMNRPCISLAVNGRRTSFCCSRAELADFFCCAGVKVVAVDMPPFMQIHAVDCARKARDSLEKFTSKTLAFTLKKEFDGVYGPAWHCIVGTSFGSFVTHSVGGFMYFSMDQKLYILLFKTTVQRAD
nr:dynein light chain LC6, flagellar outer arm-like [Coffea arabica]